MGPKKRIDFRSFKVLNFRNNTTTNMSTLTIESLKAIGSIPLPPPEFKPFPKMARLSRECLVTEKIDGTNASILITEDGQFFTGSRTRWITPDDDNYGFSKWAHDKKEELMELGPGHHFGEWWGRGIQRNYGLQERRFSLFNAGRWADDHPPACCNVVPILYQGEFKTGAVDEILIVLRRLGSFVAPGFMNPEGIIIYHTAARVSFKKTIDGDDKPKSLNHLDSK